MIPRVVAGLTAVASALAFGVWLDASYAEQRARAVAYTPPRSAAPARIRSALADSRAARRLGPDAQALTLEALLLWHRGKVAEPGRLLERAARLEPDNTGAWLLLANTSPDPALRDRARRRVAELNPMLAERSR